MPNHMPAHPFADPHIESLEAIYRHQANTHPIPPKLHNFAAGDSIWLHPERIWVVSQGIVQLNLLHPSGDEVILGLAGPGMPFGSALTTLAAYQARALINAELMSFTLAEVESSPNLNQSLFRGLSRRLRQVEAILAISSHRRIEDRLRHLLFLLRQEVGHPHPQGHRLAVRLTHQQLASAIGTSRVTITRLLGKLREENWLKFDRDRHLILTPAITALSL